MLIGMIWIILVFLLLLQFGLYGAWAGSALVILVGLLGAFRRHWRPPNTALNWIVGVWFLVSVLGYAFGYSLDLDSIVRMLSFAWIILLYSLVFVFERARPDEDDVWHAGFLFLGFGIWQIILCFIPHEFDLSLVNIDGPKIDLLLQVSEVNAVFFALTMGYCLTQIRFFNRSKWLLLGATVCLGSALIIGDQSVAIAASLFALFFMSLIFSVRLWLFLIFPLVAIVLYEEAGRIFQLFHQFDPQTMWATIRSVGVWGQGFGSATNINIEILRVFTETGWVGLICFLLIQGYFLRLGLKIWRVSSDRNAFNKGLSLGLLGADLTLFGLSIFGLGLSSPVNMAVSAAVWAAQIWLGFETRVLRRRLG